MKDVGMEGKLLLKRAIESKGIFPKLYVGNKRGKYNLVGELTVRFPPAFPYEVRENFMGKDRTERLLVLSGKGENISWQFCSM